MAEPIETPFVLWTRVSPWGAHGRHLANTTEPSMCCGDAAFCQITLTTCLLCVCRADLRLRLLRYYGNCLS